MFNKWIDHKQSKEDLKKWATDINCDETEDKVIDIELATKILGGKLKTAREMIKTLVKMLPDHMDNIVRAFWVKEYEKLSKEAHKLYGATCYCGVPRLKKSLKILEIGALKEKEERKIQDLVAKTCNEIDAVIREYESNDSLK